jgi:hypothetical protein
MLENTNLRALFVSRLSNKGPKIELGEPLELLTKIKMNLGDMPEELASKDSYEKAIQCTGKDANSIFPFPN